MRPERRDERGEDRPADAVDHRVDAVRLDRRAARQCDDLGAERAPDCDGDDTDAAGGTRYGEPLPGERTEPPQRLDPGHAGEPERGEPDRIDIRAAAPIVCAETVTCSA